MTCPIESLPRFYHEHWDVEFLCAMSGCVECTAEAGEGILWHLACPPSGPSPEPPEANCDDVPY